MFEGDVVHRRLENRATDAEGARGVAAALGLLRVIAAPRGPGLRHGTPARPLLAGRGPNRSGGPGLGRLRPGAAGARSPSCAADADPGRFARGRDDPGGDPGDPAALTGGIGADRICTLSAALGGGVFRA
jgi:hypothetical protein